MSAYSFKLPDLGEGIVESEISAWHVSVGDSVEEDDLLADVQTDKAIVEVTSPVSGTIAALGCDAGEVLAVGAELVSIATEDAVTENIAQASTSQLEQPAQAPADQAVPKTATPTPTPSSDAAFRQVLASPSLRKRAREEGINLADVPGSGPKGRISHQDFDAFLTSGLTAGSTTGLATGGDLAVQAPLPLNTTREIKLSGMRRVIARKMLASKRNIPHYSYIEEVDVTELESLRAHLNTERETHQPKLTLLPFLALALVKVLPRFPHCNARFDDEAEVLTEFDAIHLGVATMTDAGLMVPVLTHCEVMDVWQVAAEVARLSDLARDGKASPQQLSGATITISSLGAIGGIATTPIINAPETTIVGVNKMQERPVVRKGEIVVRTMMNLSASFDHRIVDGYDGAQLVQSLKSKLENPGAIFV